MDIQTTLLPDGQVMAIDADNYEPGQPIGYGDTDDEAEADLRYQLPELDDEAAMEKLRKLQHVHRELRELRSA